MLRVKRLAIADWRREIKADVKKQHDLHVNNLVCDIKVNPRDFYRYFYSQRYSQGIPPLKRRNDSGLAESELEQADEFNGQVLLPNRSAPFIEDIHVSPEGVRKTS